MREVKRARRESSGLVTKGYQGLPAPSMTYKGLPASYRTATAAEGETAKSANHANERRAAECSPDHETEAQNFTYIYRHGADMWTGKAQIPKSKSQGADDLHPGGLI